MSTGIPYCDETLEVTGGCTKCSPGCRICWAVKEVWRMAHSPLLGDKWQGLVEKKNGELNWTGKIKCFDDALQIPLKRKKPTTLFHPKVPFEFIEKVFRVIDKCPQHTFQILTKRPRRALEYTQYMLPHLNEIQGTKIEAWYWPENIWFGISISNQAEADEKIPILLQIPAVVRWLSIEPCLDGIVIPKEYLGKEVGHYLGKAREKELTAEQFISGDYPDNFIDWVIVGCESGPKRRPCKLEWVQSIVDQCKAAGVACFVKQISIDGKIVKMPKGFPQELPE